MATRFIKGSGIKSGFDITGVGEVMRMIEEVVPKEGAKILRATVHGVAADIGKDARKNARAVGQADLRAVAKNIKWKRKKSRPEKPKSTVLVEHGLGVPGDPWYWHFWEYGTQMRKNKSGRLLGKIPETAFLRTAKEKGLRDFDVLAKKHYTKQVASAVAKAKKKGKASIFRFS